MSVRAQDDAQPLLWSAEADRGLKDPERQLLDAIAAGELDPHLVAIADAIDARRELLQTLAAAKALAELRIGDYVMFNHKVRPRNLTDSTYFAAKTDKEIFETVDLGGQYTGHSEFMPGWGGLHLSPAQIKHVVSYVRTLSRTPSRP